MKERNYNEIILMNTFKFLFKLQVILDVAWIQVTRRGKPDGKWIPNGRSIPREEVVELADDSVIMREIANELLKALKKKKTNKITQSRRFPETLCMHENKYCASILRPVRSNLCRNDPYTFLSSHTS